MRVSFDFDGTIEHETVQKLARKFIGLGAEVFIVTSRPSPMISVERDYPDIAEVLDSLNLTEHSAKFTGYRDKAPYLRDFDLHIDNSETECIELIGSTCVGLQYRHANFNKRL